MSSAIIAGVFVGGASSRMGGAAKGLLEAPDGGTIVDRWRGLLRAAGVSEIVLCGVNDAYASLGLECIEDVPECAGPLGGVVALLRRAGDRRALAVACDMPFVSPGLIEKLVRAPDAPLVAPRLDGRWEPFCARYDAPRVLPVAKRQMAADARSLQRLFDVAGAVQLHLSPAEIAELRDWDTPEDIGEREAGPPTR